MGPIAILRNWTFCLFYVMAELWGSVVVSLLFWGFANQVSHPGSGEDLPYIKSLRLSSSIGSTLLLLIAGMTGLSVSLLLWGVAKQVSHTGAGTEASAASPPRLCRPVWPTSTPPPPLLEPCLQPSSAWAKVETRRLLLLVAGLHILLFWGFACQTRSR